MVILETSYVPVVLILHPPPPPPPLHLIFHLICVFRKHIVPVLIVHQDILSSTHHTTHHSVLNSHHIIHHSVLNSPHILHYQHNHLKSPHTPTYISRLTPAALPHPLVTHPLLCPQ